MLIRNVNIYTKNVYIQDEQEGGKNRICIEPPAFFHRFIGTLQPLWPEGRPLSLPIRPFLA